MKLSVSHTTCVEGGRGGRGRGREREGGGGEGKRERERERGREREMGRGRRKEREKDIISERQLYTTINHAAINLFSSHCYHSCAQILKFTLPDQKLILSTLSLFPINQS